MDDLKARISFQWDIRDSKNLCLSETWLTPLVPDNAVTPSDNFSVLRMGRTAEAGKTKGGGVCFMINKKWCDPRCISILSRSCSPHLTFDIYVFSRRFYPKQLTVHLGYTFIVSMCVPIWNICPLSAAHSICPRSFHRSSLLLFKFYHRQTLAWLCPNSTMSSAATSTNTLTLPLSLWGTLTKPTFGRSCQTFTNMYPVQLGDRIHWIIATLSLRMPTKLTHCRLLANQTMPPFSSHRNINKASFRNPRWREKWSSHAETMLQAALDDVNWHMFRASSFDVSEFTDVALSFVNTLTEQATETVTITIKLTVKLTGLGLNSSLCDWIKDFITCRPQVMKMGQFTSNSITLNIGAPHGCVLSPLLYSLYTHDCVSSHSSTSIVKFADDTVVLGLISNNDETAYLDEVETYIMVPGQLSL